MPPSISPNAALLAEQKQRLENFVVNNDDLLALESTIGKFNIFDALGIARAEIRHSNFLAFILDPVESHGQGDIFLKGFLMDLFKRAPEQLRPLSPIDLDGALLRGVVVRREWQRIDLLITCQEPKFAVVIENKIDASEHSNQLQRYGKVMGTHFPTVRTLFVYLTRRDEEPSEPEKWLRYSYADLFTVLNRVRSTYRSAIGDDVRVFLDHYLSLVGNRFMENRTIDELCQRIYKTHRQALDLIYERVGKPASEVLAAADSVLEGDSRWHRFDAKSSYVDFVPAAWLQWLSPIGLNEEDQRSWIVFRFHLRPAALNYYVLIRRITNSALRKEIVDALLQKGAAFGFKRPQTRGDTEVGTRVSGRETVIEWEDSEPASDQVQAAVRRKLDEVFPKLDGVPALLKPLLNRPATEM